MTEKWKREREDCSLGKRQTNTIAAAATATAEAIAPQLYLLLNRQTGHNTQCICILWVWIHIRHNVGITVYSFARCLSVCQCVRTWASEWVCVGVRLRELSNLCSDNLHKYTAICFVCGSLGSRSYWFPFSSCIGRATFRESILDLTSKFPMRPSPIIICMMRCRLNRA